ncbi:MAG: hypothetical protein WC306_01715 [Candidatus Paceibacterota bacterium]|jgi:hypothetical protein
MKEKINPQKGFIKTSLLITIVASIVIVTTAIGWKISNLRPTITTTTTISIMTTTTTILPTITELPSTTTTLASQSIPEIFDVKITSVTCEWVVIKDKYGNSSDCLRDIATGTASGPVGARLELPILVWSDDKLDCGAWTYYNGALVTVGNTCRRKAGQPETITWTVDTEGNECPLKNYFNNNRTYSVKIYDNDDLYEKKKDEKKYLCQ